MELAKYGCRICAQSSLAAALSAVEARSSDTARQDLAVLARLNACQCHEALGTLKTHLLTRSAGILIVNDQLKAEEIQELLKSGAECYCKPFLAAIFSARARGLLRRRKNPA